MKYSNIIKPTQEKWSMFRWAHLGTNLLGDEGHSQASSTNTRNSHIHADKRNAVIQYRQLIIKSSYESHLIYIPEPISFFTFSTLSATSDLDGANEWEATAKSKASSCLRNCNKITFRIKYKGFKTKRAVSEMPDANKWYENEV